MLVNEPSPIIRVQDVWGGAILTEDLHQMFSHLDRSLGFERPQDGELAEAVLIVEDVLIVFVWAYLHTHKVSLPMQPNILGHDRSVDDFQCRFPILVNRKMAQRRTKRTMKYSYILSRPP
ncbi:hypothetical protein LOD99_10637 [Oopsacas minuta]|uniref:Uncharacterized protein n=1 Tax=Oopsacas minuta TaxID=111878 RepID=A0AAV7KEK7_9METZ|nr:hypothetical protein LOD99_10637 [Oopsacas minuta]